MKLIYFVLTHIAICAVYLMPPRLMTFEQVLLPYIFNTNKIEDGLEYNMVVSDNGIGIPEDLDIRKTKSLGLQLIMTLIEDQLSGVIELDRTKGTEFRVKFREQMYKQRI